ncbi:MAG: HD domain-containing protein, partial [Ferrimicrobium sp.]
MGSARSVLELLGEPRLLGTFGEELPLIDHLCQTAEVLWHDSDDSELAVAGLLHDLGWSSGSTEAEHASDGLRLALALGFSERVGQLIGLHVTAKRYLVRTDSRYWGRLSRESRATLVEQGG